MAAFNFHKRRTRRWWYVGTTFVVAAFFAVFFVTSSAALINSPSNFEAGDGNMLLGTSGNTDWNCFQGLTGFHSANYGPGPGQNTLGASDCGATTGATNNSSPNPKFEQTPGEKFDTACPTFKVGNNPPKDVWSDVGQYLESATNGDLFFYGASIRPVVNGNSSGNIYFSQGTNPNGANCRTKGDVLLTFDFLGGGSKPTLHLLTWQVGSGSCYVGSDSTTTGCWGPSTPETINGDNSDGETNASLINGADNGLNGQDVLANGFSEIGVNLTQAIKAAGGTTTCFANETWVSRSSGSSFTSSPEMVVSDQQPTCGSITVIKHTLDGAGNRTGIDQSFGYTTTGGLTPSTFNLNDKGYSISSITATNPAVVTTSAANTISSGQTVEITGSNSSPTANGTWVATKISTTQFSIPLNLSGGTAGTAAGTVLPDVANTQTYSDLSPGAYSVTENSEPQNFAFVSLNCKNNNTLDNSVVSGETATIGLQPQDNWVCTYVNQQQLGAILITKTGKYKGCSTQTAGSAIMVGTTPTQIGICGPSTALTTAKLGGATFSVTSSGTAISGSPFTTSNTTGAVCIGGLPFGTYSVTETGAPTGYKVDSASAVSVSVSAYGTCNSGNTGIGTGASGVVTGTTSAPSFSDTPKTDITVEAKTQLSGATQSTVTCGSAVDTSGTPTNNIGDSPKGPAGDAKVTDNNESPGTYYCKIVVDP